MNIFLSNIIDTLLVCAVYGWLISIFIFPVVMVFVSQNTLMMANPPRSAYFYDIDTSCNYTEKQHIDNALSKLSGETGVYFIYIPSPLAGISGGISYSCNKNYSQYAGTSETGVVGVSYIIIIWNHIILSDITTETILHETLHSMGFSHRDYQTSIMYPIQHGQIQIDRNIVDLIKVWYVRNPLAYLSIITVNMVIITFGILLIIILLLH